ncbi:MAG: hypothetical protein WCW87_00830 [Candidatus Paceibacterota bacterium]
MEKNSARTGVLKIIIGWIVVFVIRLMPFRPPNVEPVMTTMMPFAKRYGYLVGFSFAFLSIAIFDLFTGKLGQWTLITGITYGLLGISAAWFLPKGKNSIKSFVIFALFSTIIYDAITGLSIGPIFFGQSLSEAFWGQIPFTLWHLAGNIAFAVTLSPAIEYWIIKNPNLEVKLIHKTI